MRSLHRSILARWRSRAGQQGYVLMFVLGIIGLTSVVVIALLGLALTSARVAQQEAALARETRAADGGLEAAVSKVASYPGDPCEAINGTTSIDFAGQDGANLPVSLSCDPSGTPDTPGAELPGPDVEVVGLDKYTGSVTVPSVPGASDPTFVATGTSPLLFNSDVRVNRGGAPSRADGGDPAVRVSGQYTQGSSVGGSGCGVLGATGPNQIRDNDGAPTCGTATSVSAVSPATAAAFGPAPSRSWSCASGSVVLAPGRYSTSDIEQLNDLLSGSAACTVIFGPGAHYLDVFDKRQTGADRFALRITNPNVRVVGGQPRNVPVAATDFPRACRTDGAADGVQLVLSGRSAIRHTAGQVALCPRRAPDGAALPVVVQTDTADVQPVQAAPPTASGFTNPERLAQNGAWSIGSVCRQTIDYFFGIPYVSAVTCTPPPSFTTTWRTTGVGALTSAHLLIDMQQVPYTVNGPDTPASYHEIPLSLQLQVNKGAKSCTVDNVKPGRSVGATVDYDLLTGACASQFTDQADLDGAAITVAFIADPAAFRGLDVQAKNVRLETNSDLVMATRVDSQSAAWANPGGAVGSGEASVNQTAAIDEPTPLKWDKAGTEYQLTVSGFTPPAALPTSATLQSLQVVMRAAPTAQNQVSDPADGAKVRFTLTAGGKSCTSDDSATTSKSFATSNQVLRYDLQGTDCFSAISKVSDLAGTTLQVTFVTGCTDPQLPFAPPDQCSSVPVPRIDQIGLAVRTDTMLDRPPSSGVTVATDRSTSFDAFGPVLLPRTDLDIHWAGARFSTPLFRDRLQVHGLGSDQTAGADVGIVCCTSREGVGVVQAKVDGTTRAQAVLKVDPDAVLPRKVTILDWKLCGRGGC